MLPPLVDKSHTADAGGEPHYHRTERGLLVRCYHKSKTEVTRIGFWVGLTIGYPIEHLLWEGFLLHHWPFSLIKLLVEH